MTLVERYQNERTPARSTGSLRLTASPRQFSQRKRRVVRYPRPALGSAFVRPTGAVGPLVGSLPRNTPMRGGADGAVVGVARAVGTEDVHEPTLEETDRADS